MQENNLKIQPFAFDESRAFKKDLEELVELSMRFAGNEGASPTVVPFLSVTRRTKSTPMVPGILTPSLCLILQGTKSLHLGGEVLYYHAGDYLAAVIDMPASGQVIGATEHSPYIGLRIDFTTKEIASVVMEAKISVKPRETEVGAAAFIGKSDIGLLEALIKLMKLSAQTDEAHYLSELIKKEIIYRLLTGVFGPAFLRQALFDQQSDGIGKAIGWIRENFTRPFTVEDLAKFSNMSVSGLHHKFKAITTMGPLQYQKQLRLLEARRLMLGREADATTAALKVGYESPSQFSREYRRLFGLPPLQDVKAMRSSEQFGE